MSETNSGSKSRYLNTLLASTALVSAGAASAQPQPAPVAQADRSGPIEEIVVRGVARQFRPQEQDSATGLRMSLVETPQAVSVVTPEMMDTINADSAYEATDLVPGVQRSGFGFGLEQIVMRGVFNTRHRVNDILLGNGFTSVEGYALDRLEIVRGPATAVYGVTGSFGGEINNILKRPRRVFEAEVGGEVGSYDSHNVFADITGPLNDEGTIAGRLVVKYDQYGLPLDIDGEDFPNYEYMVLGSIAWDITPRTTLRLTHHHQERNMDPWDGGALIENPDGSLALPDVDPETWYFSHPDQSKETLDIEFGIVELEHEFENGWRTETKVAWNKYDEDLAYFYPFGPFGAYSLADDEVYIYTYDTNEDGEDLTFHQTLGGDFEFLDREHQFFAAVEYTDNLDPYRFQLLNSFFQGYGPIDMYEDDVYDGTPRFSDGSPFLPIAGDREEQFGIRQVLLDESEDLKLSFQMLLNVTDRLEILGGVLYHDNDSVTEIPFNQGVQLDPPTVDKVGFEETVYRFGATYGLVENWGAIDQARVYYSYSEGFEPQTFTNADGETVSAPQEMEQHEVGLKTEMLGGSVGFSAALYDYEITNIQVSSSFLGSFGGFGSTVLEGSQEATGLELQLIGEILPGWNVSANYAYIDVEINDPNFEESGLPRTTPEHSGALTTTYEFLDGPAAGLRVGTTIKISDDYSFIEGPTNVGRFGSLVAGGHERVDLHASYAPRGGRWQNLEVTFNWRNVFDEDIIVAKQGNPGYGIMFLDQEAVTVGLRYQFD